MTAQLLPANFDEMIRQAVQVFWQSRSKASPNQPGGRSSVIDGRNLDRFLEVTRKVAEHCGIPAKSVITTGRNGRTIPGYFRPTKTWDTLILHEGRLIAVIEYKSIVGSLACARPVKLSSPHFQPSPEFEGASYAQRFNILCERLMSEKLYDAAALMLSPEEAGRKQGNLSSMSPSTDVRILFTLLAGRLIAERDLL